MEEEKSIDENVVSSVDVDEKTSNDRPQKRKLDEAFEEYENTPKDSKQKIGEDEEGRDNNNENITKSENDATVTPEENKTTERQSKLEGKFKNKKEGDAEGNNNEEEITIRKEDLSSCNESETIYIKNLKRPLHNSEVLALLGKYGTVEQFWINKIKSECYAVYTNIEEAKAAKQDLDGIKWPPHGVNLEVNFVSKSAAVNTSSGSGGDDSLDTLFKKTKTKPHIYWLPLTDEEVEKKKKNDAN